MKINKKKFYMKKMVYKQLYINTVEYRFKLRSKEKQKLIIDSLNAIFGKL